MMDNAEIMRAACAAGQLAAEQCEPVPMVVGTAVGLSDRIDTTKPLYYVAGGVCGFAGVVIRPATCSLVRYLRKLGTGYKHYYGGWYVPARPVVAGALVQSYEINRAYASAMARVLNDAGVTCYVDSRLD